MMTGGGKIYEQARALPPKDAAYLFWTKRHELNLDENIRPDSRGFMIMVAGRPAFDVYAYSLHERKTADEGPAFDRMRRTHPNSSDEELKQAIREAVKLDLDCQNFLQSILSPDVRLAELEDIVRAVDLAKRENPGFLETTYEAARLELMPALRG